MRLRLVGVPSVLGRMPTVEAAQVVREDPEEELEEAPVAWQCLAKSISIDFFLLPIFLALLSIFLSRSCCLAQ